MAKRTEYGMQPSSAAQPEPVNSDQMPQEETVTAALPAGPTAGELEERTTEAELRAEAAERRNEDLEDELRKLQAQVQALMRAAAAPKTARDGIDAFQLLDEGGAPAFDESLPHGIVYGDPQVAYLQNGHQFARDRSFIATEKHRGVPRAFNPRLVGYVKPRPGAPTVDRFDGIRDQTWT